MHRHQILGLIKDLFDGKNIVIVVSSQKEISPILDEFDRVNGWFNDAGDYDFKVCRTNGYQRVECVGNRIRFAAARSSHALRGANPDVVVVDETAQLGRFMKQDLRIIIDHGAERVALLHKAAPSGEPHRSPVTGRNGGRDAQSEILEIDGRRGG